MARKGHVTMLRSQMKKNLQTVVIALGGNAISAPGEEGNIQQQFEHTSQTAAVLCDAIQRGHRVVITHGNGPQVGNVLRRVEIASSELYPLPLEVCVADTQGAMGYMVSQCLMNVLRQRGMDRDVTTVVTTVLVDPDDPAFAHPTKPIGMAMYKDLAESHRVNDGWTITKVGEDQYRRIVPSPQPQQILELSTICRLVADDELVICCGGGGIPVIQDESGQYRGAAAVIDKDHTSALLAGRLEAQTLVILTAVEHVYVNFAKPDQKAVEHLTVDQARAYLDEGQFAAGSMKPKIEAAINFVTNSNQPEAVAIIADLNKLTDALDGTSGTRITRL